MSNRKEQNRTHYKSPYFEIILSLLVILFFFIIGLSIYCYWQGKIKNNEYNGIEAVISLIGLCVNILAIIFVFATFQQQRKQLYNNKKDVEFNRVLDLIYRQLEFTNRELKEQEDEWYAKLSILKNSQETFNFFGTFNWIFKLMLIHYDFFENLLSKSQLDILVMLTPLLDILTPLKSCSSVQLMT